jgi:hypothetical protein
VKIALLLEKLKSVPEIKTLETIHPDGTKTYTFSSVYPMPRMAEPIWYPIVVKSGQEDIDDREIEAMLRHLWMFQLDILPRKTTTISRIAASEQPRTLRATAKKK